MPHPARHLTAALPGVDLGLTPERRSAAHPLLMDAPYEVAAVLSQHDEEWVRCGWAEAVDGLRDGVTAAARMVTNPNVQHALRFHPDGTITLVHHTNAADITVPDPPDVQGPTLTWAPAQISEPVASPWHTDGSDLATVTTLIGLGARVCPCVRVAGWLLSAQRTTPGVALTRTAKAWGVGFGNIRLKHLYAAVAWAQFPFWPAGATYRLLYSGTTPRTLSEWVQSGWDTTAAVEFTRRGADLSDSEPWRIAGQTGTQAARLAVLGSAPEETQAWREVGFTDEQAYPWRSHYRLPHRPEFTPAYAWLWHQRGVRPNDVELFESLPRTQAEADARTLADQPKASATRNGRSRPMTVPTLDRALEWVAAGIPSELVWSWCRNVGDSDTALAVAQAWHPHLSAYNVVDYLDWNQSHPDQPLSPSDVARLKRLGMPTDPELMAAVVAAGLSNNDLLRPLHALPSGKRWIGIEFEHRLLADLDTFPDEWVLSRSFAEAIRGSEWEFVVNAMRRGLYGHSRAWKVLVEWLVTHPVPPRHR